jgi:hypothetical protein
MTHPKKVWNRGREDRGRLLKREKTAEQYFKSEIEVSLRVERRTEQTKLPCPLEKRGLV